MPWSYNAGILTATGGTELAPNSVMGGIDVVEAIDNTKAYRDGLIGWLNDVQVVVSNGAFIIFDDDSTTLIRGTGFIRPNAGGIIHGSRSTLIFEGSANAQGSNVSFLTGSTLITKKDRPNDPSAKVIWRNSVRVDYPSIRSFDLPAKIAIDGLDLYRVTGGGFASLYFGNATISTSTRVRIFGGLSISTYNSTYNDYYLEAFNLGPETAVLPVVFNRPTYYVATSIPFAGALRGTQVTIINPTFLNNSWNQTFNFGTCFTGSFVKINYTFKNTFKFGLTNLQGVRVRYLRERESVSGSPSWTAPDSEYNLTTNNSGTFDAVNLLDTYRADTNQTAIERFNWSLKARGYDKKTAGETVFASRVLYQHSVNMSAGYSEEVQMLQVPYITLTEAQALALTGISFAPSGATEGVVTISGARTVAELWHAYRAWISQIANFNSVDTWSYDWTNLNIGLYTIVGIENLSSGTITTNTATANGTIINLSIIGNVIQDTPTNLTDVSINGTLTYNTNSNISITLNNTTINTVVNNGNSIVTIRGGSISDYTDPQIEYLDASITFIGCDNMDSVSIRKISDGQLILTHQIIDGNTLNFKIGVNLGVDVYFERLNSIGAVINSTFSTINRVLTVGNNGSYELTDPSLVPSLSQTKSYFDTYGGKTMWEYNNRTLTSVDLTNIEVSLETINQGVKKASLLIPHNTNL